MTGCGTSQRGDRWRKWSAHFCRLTSGDSRVYFDSRHGALLLAGVLLAGAVGCVSVKRSRLEVTRPAHWTATASESAEGMGPEHALDGQTNTWWRSGKTEPQWLQLDLARPVMVCGFSLQWGRPHAVAYAVRTSRDGVNWALGFETTAGDGDWDQAALEPILARYVRIEVTRGATGTGAALRAVEIKGLADRPQAWVNGVRDPQAAALLDGDRTTVWHWPDASATVDVDLKTIQSVGSVRIDWGTNGYAQSVTVLHSTNRVDWTTGGCIQSRAGDFDVLLNEVVCEARYVRLVFADASSPNGFSVSGITLRGAEGIAQPWSRYELAATQAAEGVYPDSFRHRQTYWSVAAGLRPGAPECLLDEWGNVSASVDGPMLSPLLVAEDGAVVSAQQAAKLEYGLGAEGAPLPELVWQLHSGLTLRIRALAGTERGPAFARMKYDIINDSLMTQTGRLALVARPVRIPPRWAGGGLAPMYHIRLVDTPQGWQEMQINGRVQWAVAATNLASGVTAFEQGDAVELLRRGEWLAQRLVTDEDGLASGVWALDFAVEPGESAALVVAAHPPASARGATRRRRLTWPFAAGQPAAADEFERDWTEAAWEWRAATRGYAPQIGRPDAVECLHAQVGWLLGLSQLEDASAGAQVDTIWLRVAALLRAGQPAPARDWIERTAAGVTANGWVPARIAPSGQAISAIGQEGRHDSQGQFVFMVMEYYRFTKDRAFLRDHYSAIRSALEYLRALRRGLEPGEARLPGDQRDLLEGLLPRSGARPGFPQPAHLYADNFWALLAWKEGRAAAAALGMDEDVRWADHDYQKLRAALQRAIRARLERQDADWLPAAVEEDRFDVQTVALLLWPCDEPGLLEPHEIQSSLDWFYADFLSRDAANGAARHSTDEGLLLAPLAGMGRGDYAREVLYSLLGNRHPTGWQIWADVAARDQRQPRQLRSMPDIRAAAGYVIGMRGLAARETGGRLDIFSGAPAEWLQHGRGFEVFGMPTQFGPLDLSGFWQNQRLRVEIGGGARPPEGYRLWWPRQIKPERVLANGQHLKEFDAIGATLPHDFQGQIEAFFPFKAPWPREP